MVEAIATEIGTIDAESITEEQAALEEWAESLAINLYVTPGSLVQPSEDESTESEWHSIEGFLHNLQNLRAEFIHYRGLDRMTMFMTGPPVSGKSHYGRKLAERYNLPHLQIGGMIDAMFASKNELSVRVTKRLE